MKFAKVSRWRTRPSWLPEWVSLAAPTVAAVLGTSLVGVLPAIIATGTKYVFLLTVAVVVPCALLLVMGVLFALLLPREAGPSGGRGWPPSPSDGPQEPPWWPVFEKEFRQHVGETHRDLVSTRPSE